MGPRPAPLRKWEQDEMQPRRILNRADHYRLQLKVSDLINLISDLALAWLWRAGGPASDAFHSWAISVNTEIHTCKNGGYTSTSALNHTKTHTPNIYT